MTLSREYDELFLDGNWVPSDGDDRIIVISPTTEEAFGHVPSATKTDVDRAVDAARRTFASASWRNTSLAERSAIVTRVRDLLEARRDEFADLITGEMGSPISQSRSIQVGTPLALIDAYVDLAKALAVEDVRITTSGSALVTREPIGVVAAVVPWNVPLTVALQKIIPALLVGCTVVLKPAPETPLTTFALAGLFEEAGLPRGALNVVPADREVSEYLVSHPDIDKITFTGSTAAGRHIASIAGSNLKRITLELGGKSAGIVLDDADLDSTIESLRLGALRNSGQICTLKTRLLVSRNRHDEFVERLGALVTSMPVGDPSVDDTQIGPMVSARQRNVVQGYIDSGKSEGARVVVGGGSAPLERGWFVEPTVFTDVTPGMRIAREEIFGPVLAVLPYDTEVEAIAFANDTPYGLNGAVYTTDVAHGLALARRIVTGTVEINGHSAGFSAPIGGVKASGLGREAGPEGLEEYTELKSYGLPPEFAQALRS